MSTARELARTLGGRKTGVGYLARCPAHDDHNPSLSFRDGEWGVLLLKCFAGCDRRDVLAALRRRGLLDERPATPTRKESHAVTLPQSERARSSTALSLWHESVPIRDTLAWRYLARRGIDVSELPTGISDALRFHPSCPFGKETRQRCMVGLFTDAITAQPRAIHRTALTSSGDKLDRRMLGPAAGCVIRLWPDEDVHAGLVIGEGIETVLAAATKIAHRGTTLRPAWAASSASMLKSFPVLPVIEALTILVDNDADDERGPQAAAECARRWSAAGCEVIRLIPCQAGGDFNDVVGAP
jgi:putative DNA primase/helicase